MFLCSCCPGNMEMIITVLAEVIITENALWSVETTTFLLRQLHCSRSPQEFLYNEQVWILNDCIKCKRGKSQGENEREVTAQSLTLKKYSARTNIYPSNPSVCRWNSQLGSRVAASGGARGETVCPCWVTLRSREQGLSSRPETHTHTHTYVYRLLTHTLTHPFAYRHTLRQHSWWGD